MYSWSTVYNSTHQHFVAYLLHVCHFHAFYSKKNLLIFPITNCKYAQNPLTTLFVYSLDKSRNPVTTTYVDFRQNVTTPPPIRQAPYASGSPTAAKIAAMLSAAISAMLFSYSKPSSGHDNTELSSLSSAQQPGPCQKHRNALVSNAFTFESNNIWS